MPHRRLSKGERKLVLGNGIELKVEAVGTMRLVLETQLFLDLENTVYVPTMSRNLISISRLDVLGYAFEFRNNKLSLFMDSKLIGYGTLIDGLNKLDLDSTFS